MLKISTRKGSHVNCRDDIRSVTWFLRDFVWCYVAVTYTLRGLSRVSISEYIYCGSVVDTWLLWDVYGAEICFEKLAVRGNYGEALHKSVTGAF